jgi:hypothetical protein
MPESQSKLLTENIISHFIQKTESEILQVNDWNLDLSNGSDILNMILKLSNDEYNFDKILDKVNRAAVD